MSPIDGLISLRRLEVRMGKIAGIVMAALLIAGFVNPRAASGRTRSIAFSGQELKISRSQG